jgi:hypothetical protein
MEKTLLPVDDMNRLHELERIVKRGSQWFVEVGNALVEIRDSRLYRYAFKTFEDYCRDKWGWSRVRAHQMIEAASVAESLPPQMLTVVNTERQARELAKVEPEHREAVITKAAESGKVTAKAIKEAHAELVEVEPPEDEPTPEESPFDKLTDIVETQCEEAFQWFRNWPRKTQEKFCDKCAKHIGWTQ